MSATRPGRPARLVLPPPRRARLRGAGRARGAHAAGPGRAPRLDHREDFATARAGPGRARTRSPRNSRCTSGGSPTASAARRSSAPRSCCRRSSSSSCSPRDTRGPADSPILGVLFYGVGAAVIAVLARAGMRLARSTVRRDRSSGPSPASMPSARCCCDGSPCLLVLAEWPARDAGARSAARGTRAREPARHAASSSAPISMLAQPAGGLARRLAAGALRLLRRVGARRVRQRARHRALSPRRRRRRAALAHRAAVSRRGRRLAAHAGAGGDHRRVHRLPRRRHRPVASSPPLGCSCPRIVVVLIVAPRFGAIRAGWSRAHLREGVTAAAVGALLGAVVVMATRDPRGPADGRDRRRLVRLAARLRPQRARAAACSPRRSRWSASSCSDGS